MNKAQPRKKIILAVISDLNTDQRIQKVAGSLQHQVGDVCVVCRDSGGPNPTFPFSVKRIKSIFNKGFLFYAWFNISLFLRLLFINSDIIVANDADTLLPAYYVAKIKGIKIVFDSHEIMSEVPEVISRPRVQKIWQWIENTYIPKVPFKYTVCESLKNHYNCGFKVIRNVPYKIAMDPVINQTDEKMILYQGSVNMGRGIENLIEALPHIKGLNFVVVGDGYQLNEIKNLAAASKAADRIQFLGKMSPDKLRVYTRLADLGISIEENMGLNYYYALPNKLMDYIQAGVPVLVSDFPEMRQIVEKYNVGEVLQDCEPKKLAEQINRMLADKDQYSRWKKNTLKAANELCWEIEEQILLDLFNKVIET